jgi:PEP-CTERM motif
MLKGIAFLAFSLTVLLTVGSAEAGFVVYTSRSSFEAALVTETTETFTELGSTFQTFSSGLSQANGLTDPLTITGSSGFLFSTSSSASAGFYPANGTYLLGPSSSSSTDGITVVFPAHLTAAGADVNLFGALGTIDFSGTTSLGENFSGSVTVNGSLATGPFGFLGVTTTGPNDYITSLLFSAVVGANTNVVVDNVSFGTVPEPASITLLGSGVLLVGAVLLRRRRIRSARC